MTKQEMYTAVINKFGFEHQLTIWFFEIAERITEEQLATAYNLLEQVDIFEEE